MTSFFLFLCGRRLQLRFTQIYNPPFTGADRRNYNFVINGRSKDGTLQFETYATMQAASEERLPTVTVVRLTEDTTKVKFVRRLLSESKKMRLKKSITLMNRELGNVEVMRFLDGHGEKFPMTVFYRLQGRIPIISEPSANTPFQPLHRFHLSQITASNDHSYKSTANREMSDRSTVLS